MTGRLRGKHLTVVIWKFEVVWVKLADVKITENWEIMIKIKKYNLRSRKVNDMVGNSKSNDFDFNRIEI